MGSRGVVVSAALSELKVGGSIPTMGDSHTVGPCKKAVFACLAADESYLTLQRGGIFPVFRKREK